MDDHGFDNISPPVADVQGLNDPTRPSPAQSDSGSEGFEKVSAPAESYSDQLKEFMSQPAAAVSGFADDAKHAMDDFLHPTTADGVHTQDMHHADPTAEMNSARDEFDPLASPAGDQPSSGLLDRLGEKADAMFGDIRHEVDQVLTSPRTDQTQEYMKEPPTAHRDVQQEAVDLMTSSAYDYSPQHTPEEGSMEVIDDPQDSMLEEIREDPEPVSPPVRRSPSPPMFQPPPAQPTAHATSLVDAAGDHAARAGAFGHDHGADHYGTKDHGHENLLDFGGSSSSKETKPSTSGATTASGDSCPFALKNWDPKLLDLIYWRDPKKSGAVLGVTLALLVALKCCSVVSVVAYAGLLVLIGTLSYRIVKAAEAKMTKSSPDSANPFKKYLDQDVSIPEAKVHEQVDVVLKHVHELLLHLRRLFLVEDIGDSLKFGVLLWALTYVGCWFTGTGLLIIGVLAVFSLPKVYELYKEPIDQHYGIAHAKVTEAYGKVQEKVPMLKKKQT